METFQTLLKQNNLKATNQRLAILDVIEEMGHVTIDEITETVQKRLPTTAIGTIYKNIQQLVDAAILREVSIEGQKSRYETSKSSHIHFICRECGSVTDYPVDTKKQFTDICTKEGFALEAESVNLYGVCSACKSAQKSA